MRVKAVKIKVESNEDSLIVLENIIKVTVAEEEYVFEISDVEQVLIITNDLGPIYDDMCLAIRIGSETTIFIMSEHPSYKEVLFEQLGKIINLDYKTIIQASTCIDNNIFVIYNRE